MNDRSQPSQPTFGIFDHLEEADQDTTELFDARVRLLEAYEVAGFYAYRLAEYHGRPSGLASSPRVFVAAVVQRTKRIRLGPLVMNRDVVLRSEHSRKYVCSTT